MAADDLHKVADENKNLPKGVGENPDARKIIEDQAQEIKQLRRDQQDLMSRVRVLVTNFPLGLVVVNRDQCIEAANNKAMEYFGYSSEEMAKMPLNVILPEVKNIQVSSQPERFMGRKKSGETFAVECVVNVFDIVGEERLFVSIQDITERFRLEKLRRDLIGMVSHDLRTPLTSIRLTLEMAKAETFGAIDKRGERLFTQSVTSIEYLTGLIENLLDSEKMETGIELEYAHTTVDKIIQKTINTIPKQDINIETEYTNDSLEADRDRIVQILINLISNAIKYSPENGTVRVVAGMEGVMVKFQVIDQGPGVPKELQSIVFERYRQLDQPKGIKKKGFGLGLAICRHLVDAHGGKIWVESDGKNGSKFCFTIPIEPERADNVVQMHVEREAQ